MQTVALVAAITLASCLLLGLVIVVVIQGFALRAIHRELDRREAAATDWLIRVESERLRRAQGLEDAIRSISRTARGGPQQ